jgi:RHS repeat-associated protein
LAYDLWGNRRNPDDWTQQAASTTHYLFNRGYTLHEHLDAFALINMGGRVYDPTLGTFISPDPYIQAADNWLNYNRYSYCLGNPLRYNDPTGKEYGSVNGVSNGYESNESNSYNVAAMQEVDRQRAGDQMLLDAAKAMQGTASIVTVEPEQATKSTEVSLDVSADFLSGKNTSGLTNSSLASPASLASPDTGDGSIDASSVSLISSAPLPNTAGGYDIDKAISALDKNALPNSSKYCARYVRYALEKGGLNTKGHPVSAKDYDSFLLQKGFQVVEPPNYFPMKGDIVVMKAFKGSKPHPDGHIQMYNGTKWESDFRQSNFWPGSDYIKFTPHFIILRWK